MFRRRHILVLVAIPFISIIVTWVFCLQENLQQIAEANVGLEESLQVLQEKLDRLDKEAKNEALLSAASESEEIQEGLPLERRETIARDSHVRTVHIVKRGETLHAIGMKYGISWTTLLKHNSLDRPNTIYAGQELKIPLKRDHSVHQLFSGTLSALMCLCPSFRQ